MDDSAESRSAASSGPRFSIATLMELTAACAVSASLAWWIGPVASFVLMLASCGIVLRQGWAVLVAMTLLCAIAGANYAGRIHRGDFLGVGLSMVFIGLFAWYRVALRKRLLRKSRDT